MRRSVRSPSLLALCAALSACGSTPADTTFAPYTDLHVDPETFRGELPCGTAPGAMRSYVVKLWDVTGQAAVDLTGATPIIVSQPTQCAQSAAFSVVQPGSFYVGTIDAYDIPRPCLDAASCGAVTAPVASTDCGFGKGPEVPPPPPLEGEVFGPPDATQSIYLRRVLLRGCRAMQRASSAATSSTRALVAGVGCGTGVDQVERLKIVRADAATFDLLCGDPLPLATVGATGSRASIFAYAPQAESPRWGTTCEVGATALACAPLSDRGAIVVRGADVCGGATGDFHVRAVGGAAEATAPCAGEASLASLPVAAYTLLVDGGGQASCKAVVSPGQQTVATCVR